VIQWYRGIGIVQRYTSSRIVQGNTGIVVIQAYTDTGLVQVQVHSTGLQGSRSCSGLQK